MDRLHILPRMLIYLLLEQKGVPQTFLLRAHSLVYRLIFCQAESHFRSQAGAAALNIFCEAITLRKRTSAVHNFPLFRKNLSQSIPDWTFPIHEKMVFSQARFLLIMAVELVNWNMLNVILRHKPVFPSWLCHANPVRCAWTVLSVHLINLYFVFNFRKLMPVLWNCKTLKTKWQNWEAMGKDSSYLPP